MFATHTYSGSPVLLRDGDARQSFFRVNAKNKNKNTGIIKFTTYYINMHY